MADKLRIAVIGCGSIARAHLNAMRNIDEAELIATVDIEEDRAKGHAEEYGAERYYTEWAGALADDDVDAVIICLPHHLHAKAAIDAAEHKKHILTEKPMAISLAQTDSMIEAAESKDVRLMVGQVLRFRECNIRARELLNEGRIGKPHNMIRRRLGYSREFRSHWASSPEQAGGWVLYGYGSHEVDMMLWLFDTYATRVYAEAEKNNPYWNDYDEISIQMRLANGVMSSLHHSINCRRGAWDTFIIGSDGSMYITNDRIEVNGETIETPMNPSGGMEPQLREFVNAVLKEREPEASGANVRRTMQALEAAKLSIRQQKVIETDGM